MTYSLDFGRGFFWVALAGFAFANRLAVPFTPALVCKQSGECRAGFSEATTHRNTLQPQARGSVHFTVESRCGWEPTGLLGVRGM
jgi:hypothetical protein